MSHDPELERFKALDLVAFAEAHGYRVTGQRQQITELRHPEGDRVDIAQDDDGHHIFKSWNGDAQGSIVDFVQHIHPGATLGRVRQILRPWTSNAPLSSSFRPIHPQQARRTLDRPALRAVWSALSPYRGGYLEARGLKAATVSAAADRVRTDERGNVAFRHDDLNGLTGWELKNQGFTGFSSGGRKGLFAVRAGLEGRAAPSRVVIAESALDALSFWQIDPTPALLLSFAGGISASHQEPLLRAVLTKYPAAQIVTATDADEQGERYAAHIATMRPDAIRARPPVGKDWNDTLLNRSAKAPRPPSRNTP